MLHQTLSRHLYQLFGQLDEWCKCTSHPELLCSVASLQSSVQLLAYFYHVDPGILSLNYLHALLSAGSANYKHSALLVTSITIHVMYKDHFFLADI